MLENENLSSPTIHSGWSTKQEENNLSHALYCKLSVGMRVHDGHPDDV